MNGDAIFLVKNDDSLVQMNATGYESESLLQNLLGRSEKYSDLLAGGQINPAAPRRWLLIDREVGVPATEGGAAQWSVDHLFVDQDGIPTIIEVKRSTDTRIRREVVGQMLDYAANGVCYWPIEKLREAFNQTATGEKENGPALRLADFLGDGADPEDFWAKVSANLRTGHIRLIFVADQIPNELKRVVEFLNEQMTDTEVLAVEIKQYTGAGLRTLVPRLIGATAAAQQVKERGPRATFADLLAKAAPEVQETEKRLLDLVARRGLSSTLTTAARVIKTSDGLKLMIFYPGFGGVEFSLRRVRDAGMEKEAAAVLRTLVQIAGKPLTERNPFVPCSGLNTHWDSFEKDFLQQYIEIQRAASLKPPSGESPDLQPAESPYTKGPS